MKEYLLLFRAIEGTRPTTPEGDAANMELWKNWIGSIAEKGKLIGGQPLNSGGRLMSKGGTVTDAPFAEGKEVLNGYLITKAADYSEAEEQAKGCPIFNVNGSVEIREIQKMDIN